MSEKSFRNWKSFIESDEVGLDGLWMKSIVMLAQLQASDEDLEEPPEFDDPEEVFDLARKKRAPAWWPEKLERVSVKINRTAVEETPEMLGPFKIDPNDKSLGIGTFKNTLTAMLDDSSNFDGHVKIEISRIEARTKIGGWSSEIYIGDKKKKRRGESTSGSEEIEELKKALERKDSQMERMFASSANVIQASAGVVNATRGVNPTPPWMNGGDESTPFWQTLMNLGGVIAQSAFGGGGTPKAQISNIMSTPVSQHPMIAGPTIDQSQEQQQIGGRNQFLEQGRYDGFQYIEEEVVDDEYAEVEEEYEWKTKELGDAEEKEESEEDSEEESDEESEELTEKKPKKKEKSPDEMSDEELSAYIEKRAKAMPKDKMMAFGTRLASKLMR